MSLARCSTLIEEPPRRARGRNCSTALRQRPLRRPARTPRAGGPQPAAQPTAWNQPAARRCRRWSRGRGGSSESGTCAWTRRTRATLSPGRGSGRSGLATRPRRWRRRSGAGAPVARAGSRGAPLRSRTCSERFRTRLSRARSCARRPTLNKQDGPFNLAAADCSSARRQRTVRRAPNSRHMEATRPQEGRECG